MQDASRSGPAPRSSDGATPDFLSGGGEMGALMRAHDWTRSPLGPPERWPQSLRTVVSLLLTSKFPMFLAWGPELAFLYNDGYRPILGTRHPAALGRPFTEVWSEIWHDIGPLVDRALEGEASFHENLPLTMERYGYPEETYFTFSYSPVRDETGGIAGMFCACTETTRKVLAERHLRAAEEALRTSRARLDAIVRHAPVAIVLAEAPSGRVVLANAWVEHVFGHAFPAAGLSEYAAYKGFHASGRPLRPEEWPLARAVATGEVVEGEEVDIERGDGTRTTIAVSAAPIRDGDGRVAAAVLVFADVSETKRAKEDLQRLNETLEERVAARTAERERAEADLRQAQKMEAVGQLTGGVAHDFNNLLQALSSCLQMIERRAPTPQLRPLVEAGQQAIDRGAKLVQQLMAFARRQSLSPEPVDVRDRVLGMSELLARALRADIAVETDFQPDLWPVEVDPTQFELAIINLAINARDAMPEGGRLRIEARNVPAAGGMASGPGDGPGNGPGDDLVRIRVSDTGSGMTPEVLAHVFEPFFTTKEVGKGSGLGLAQVYGFARQSGGRVEVDSAPGRGTAAALFLPRTTGRIAGVPFAALPVDGITRGAQVLLVEDDPVVGAMVAAALEDVGYGVARCVCAADALATLSSGRRVDLLFSDVVMPGDMSGLDLAVEARRLRPELPVVLTTGYSEQVARAEGVRMLRKPYRVATLVEAIEVTLAGAASG